MPGIDLQIINEKDCTRRHQNIYRVQSYGAAEYSMGSYIVSRSMLDHTWNAIPFFTKRLFCHRYIYVHSKATFQHPMELINKKVGILSYQNSMAIYVKGLLSRTYNVPIKKINWVTTHKERVNLKKTFNTTSLELLENRNLQKLLLEHRIDALVSSEDFYSLKDHSDIKPFFKDPIHEENDFYNKNKIYPIMHPIVIRNDILDAYPWVAKNLYKGLLDSQIYYDNFRLENPKLSELNWLFSYKLQGFSKNIHDIQYLLSIMQEQGLLYIPLKPTAIFDKSLIES